MTQIPKQLQNPEFRFVLLGKWDKWRNKETGEEVEMPPETYSELKKNKNWTSLGKAPFEKGWQNKGYKFDDEKLLEHINKGLNYGIIGGYGNLVILDIDDTKLGRELENEYDTFTIKTGMDRRHFYLICEDKINNKVLSNEKGELRAKNYQVVCPPCQHPSGNYYEVIKDIPIRKVTSNFILGLIKPHLRKEETTGINIKEEWEKHKASKDKPKEKDTSRSGKEYREVIKLIGQGLTKEQVFKEMSAFAKWSSAPEQYKEMTYTKALGYIEATKENKTAAIAEPDESSLEILKNPDLFNLIINEFNKRIEGEEKSKKAIFLSLSSIWNEDAEIPENTFVSSVSSAGKSFICKNIIKIFPKELVEYRSKISGEAFTYWHTNESDFSWDGKICYLEDISQAVLDSQTFKVMCSEGSIATVVRNQKAVDLIVNGKPCMLVTTATTDPHIEVLNRFNIISLDESKEQTFAVTRRQAEQKDKIPYDERIINALRHLKRKSVYVPYGILVHNYLAQHYSFEDVRLRRDFDRLLGLIKDSGSLHQYQRNLNEKGQVLATDKDYEIARECINYIQTTTLKGLHHKLKKALECCLKLNEQQQEFSVYNKDNEIIDTVIVKGFNAKEIHSKFPFVSQQMWYKYLDDLCERGMLKTELIKIPNAKQRVTFFQVPKTTAFNLPEFTELTKEIEDSDTLNVLIDLNVLNVLNVLKVKERLEQLKQIKQINDKVGGLEGKEQSK